MTSRIKFRLLALLPLSALGVALGTPAVDAAAQNGAQSTLVIVTKWASDPAAGIAPPDAAIRVFTGGDSANKYFKEVSGGRMSLSGIRNPVGDVVGPVTLYGQPNCGDGLRNEANSAARAQGYDTAQYRHVIYYVTNQTPCGAGVTGNGALGGAWSIILGSGSTQTLVHELGHNFGLEHAGAQSCKDAAGTPVTFSTNCTVAEYGDPYSAMGNSAPRWYDAPQMINLGWITPAQVATSESDGAYKLDPLEDNAAFTRALVVPLDKTAGTNLYVEHRASTGQYDQFGADHVTQGVSLRIASPTSTTRLLNMHPLGAFTNSQLGVGESFTYPGVATISVTALDEVAGVATVQVTHLAPVFKTGAALPAAAVGTAYAAVINASGGVPGYTWWNTSGAGSLPPGLSLTSATPTSITLAGTPTQAGTYSFKLRVKDSVGKLGYRTFTITVA